MLLNDPSKNSYCFTLFAHEYGQKCPREMIAIAPVNRLMNSLQEALKVKDDKTLQQLASQLFNLVPQLRQFGFKNIANSDFNPETQGPAKIQKELFLLAETITESLSQQDLDARATMTFEAYFKKVNIVLAILETISALGNADIAFNLAKLYNSGRPTPSFVMPFEKVYSNQLIGTYSSPARIQLLYTQYYRELTEFFASTEEKEKYISKSITQAKLAFNLLPLAEYSLFVVISIAHFYLFQPKISSEKFLQEIFPYLQHFLLENIENNRMIESGMKVAMLSNLKTTFDKENLKNLTDKDYTYDLVSSDTFNTYKEMLSQFKEQFPSPEHDAAVEDFLMQIESLVNTNKNVPEELNIEGGMFNLKLGN